MKAEVISFRPGHDLMKIIMADCERLGITATEWVLQKVYAAMDKKNEWSDLQRIKNSIWNARRKLRWDGNLEQALEILDQTHESITIMLKK
ncbi:MAG: hypothetical protein FJX80_03865 [Bacteroidetes bacterium]|nr:hypothetical protein [Bacteroidota bacterium]